MKPKHFLQKVRTVDTTAVSENIIKTLWIGKLPDCKKCIQTVGEKYLKLTIMVDKISDMNLKPEILATSNKSDTTVKVNDNMGSFVSNDIINRITLKILNRKT